MKRPCFVLIALLSTLFQARADGVHSRLNDFITVRGDQLMEGHQPFRFISLDIPNLLLVEDNVAFNEVNPWRLPDRFEINDALGTIAAIGGTVTRTYVISVLRPNDPPGTPRHPPD